MQSHSKIFGIGLSKTGTSSLNRALIDLGIQAIHYPCDPTTFRQLTSGDYRLKVLDRYQAATDIPVAPFFAQLDREYPGSKFILTVRNVDSWLKSVDHHWAFMWEWAKHDRDFREFTEFITACVYGAWTFHTERFAYVYEEHLRCVQNYFADRANDLLVIDICSGGGWEQLCPFLGIPIPNRPFPHANKKEEKQERAKWIEELRSAIDEFEQAVPAGARYVLIDDFRLAGSELADPSRTFRIGETDGTPRDSATAIAELERLRMKGAEYLVIAWPSFWWREYYEDLWDYVNHRFKLLCDTYRLVIYELNHRAIQLTASSNGLDTIKESDYSTNYYATLREGSRTSAEIVVPWIVELVRPTSVVDVGCGTGEWLAAFKRHGVSQVLGIDGDYLDRGSLSISDDEFLVADVSKPLALDRQFDLAVSLEVAEHLPPECAQTFVQSLARLAPAVLFSAAIPHQNGEHHVNEQWPQYWSHFFLKNDYLSFDILRPEMWRNPAIEWWYIQNAVLYVRRASVRDFPELQKRHTAGKDTLPLVHPRCYLHLVWRRRVLEAIIELLEATPEGALVLVADQAEFGEWPATNRQVLPFPERNGVYAGPPADSDEALGELLRQRDRGASFLAFAWPAFWWLDYYSEFANTLRRQFPEVLRSENWVVFELQGPISEFGN